MQWLTQHAPWLSGCQAADNCCTGNEHMEVIYNYPSPTDESAGAPDLVTIRARPRLQPSNATDVLEYSPESVGSYDYSTGEEERIDREISGFDLTRRRSIYEYEAGKSQTFTVDLPNALAQWMWQAVSEYVIYVVMAVIEPSIQKALSDALGSLGGVFAFDRNNFHLGEKPVDVINLTGHQTIQKTLEGDVKHVTFTALVRWVGEPEFDFTLSKVKLGVRNVTFEGVVTVECVNVQPRPLFFRGVRMYFINPPEINMNFEGSKITSVLNSASAKSLIIDTVVEQIARRAVVPNRVARGLTPDADWFEIARPTPEGILEVTVHSCQSLIATDINFIRSNTSDPYVQIFCGALKYKSEVIKRNLNPVFDFSARLQVASVAQQMVVIELKDHDQVSKDDFLGKLEVAVASAIEWQPGKHTFELADENGQTGRNGKICISASFRPILKQTRDKDQRGTCFVFVGVHGLSHVPQMADETKFWVALRCDGVWQGNGGTPPNQATDKLGQHGAHWLAADKAAATKVMHEKLDILRRYNVSPKDIAHILEVDPAHLEKLHSTHGVGTSELTFNAGFDYIVERPESAAFSLTLMCQEPKDTSKGKKSLDAGRALGTLTVTGRELLWEPTFRRTTTLPGTNIIIKVVLELRFMAKIRAPSAQTVNASDVKEA